MAQLVEIREHRTAARRLRSSAELGMGAMTPDLDRRPLTARVPGADNPRVLYFAAS
jgi:hypothetical protein